MSGAYDEASELFKQNGAPEQAAQAAWLSEDWIELVPPETSGLGPTAALARNNEAQQQRGLGALGSAKNALAESAAAREVLELLLQEPRVLVAPDL